LRGRAFDEFIAESLVIPLVMVVGDELSQRPPKVHSPRGTTRFRHSCFTDRTNRSACALQFGESIHAWDITRSAEHYLTTVF